ncbi:VOC family protein [Micrococcus luteus]|uniref:VOC family protein n=1 Tax=Micrococcus luteus TaxID=1270 RepID=UPI003C307E8F
MTTVSLGKIDIIVPDVLEAARLLVDAFGATVRVQEPEFAEVELGGMILMFSRTALVPMQPATGLILHLEVDDPQAAAERAQAHGARILYPLTETDWGTWSVLMSGPAETVIDLFRENAGGGA